MMILGGIFVLVVVVLGWIRLAPSDPVRWHVPLSVTEDRESRNASRRIVLGDRAAFQALNEIAMATPRTTRLAGSVEEGHVTYVTRSRLMGYPDYTTVQFGESGMQIYARSRFGRSDLGVNRARVEDWLGRLQAR